MPGVDRECVTHHLACDCREAMFAKSIELLKEATKQAERLEITGAWLLETLQLIAKYEGRAQ